MKKIYRATYRYDKQTNDSKDTFLSRVSNNLKHQTNGSEMMRAIFHVIRKDKRLCNALAREVARHLEENT